MNMSKGQRMRAIAEAYPSSGVGAKEFAASKGITLYQLKYWLSKLNKQKASSSSFIRINPAGSSAGVDLVEMEYPNGVKMKLAKTDLSLLSQLVKLY